MKKYTMSDYNNAENMNVEEVIDHLLYVKRGYIGNYNFTGNELDFERYKIHMAINAAVDLLRNLSNEE